VTQCYSTCVVNGGSFVGGLVGENEGTVTQCYSTGAVCGGLGVGGLVGYNVWGYVSQCFWDIQTSGQTASAGGTAKTTAEMQDKNTYLSAGWDFADEVLNGTCDYWQTSPGDYPRLRCHTGDSPVMPEGLGTAQEPYLIRDARDLGTVWFEPMGHYRLEANLDLSGITWFMGVIPWFAGTFDGNGHTISNVTITGRSYLGLFGELASGADVRDVGVVDVSITGSGEHVGGLAGKNRYGCMTNSYSTGVVAGDSSVGGLVGSNIGTVTRCYSTGAVSGDRYVGGLVGSSGGNIVASYSIGSVTGIENVGGLVGGGYPASVQSGVWDIETSGLSGSGGGVGLTTAEMMDPYVLALNGFGNEPNWVLDAGRDYPRLAWQGTPGEIIPEVDIDWLEGSGLAQDPYEIVRADQLILLGKASILWDKNFVLVGDIDLDANVPNVPVFVQAVIPAFMGVFDGNGRMISHLRINGRGCLGLFGEVSGEVRDLGVVDVNIIGSGYYVAGLVAINDGEVTGCYTSGLIAGSRYVGGVVGCNSEGHVTYCCSAGVVRGNKYVGGLVGDNSEGSINRCYSSGAVTATGSCVGGLVGQNGLGLIEFGYISNCYSSGPVTATGDNVGGLVGLNSWGDVAQCYSTGAVTGKYDVGGLVGRNGHGAVSHCYSTGAVSGKYDVGGLVGENWRGSIARSFWDMESSGQGASAGGTGKTTAEMQMESTFTSAGWDFVGETANGTEDIWRLCNEGAEYPQVSWQYLLGDFGCPDGVEINDLAILCEQWLQVGAYSADIAPGPAGDGIVNLPDFAALADNWLTGL